ncbi:Coatomer subunit delta [Morella rubra]|uniref:Coatomer subunit delta n=1 Tax=Morella rubra TaxID=262757 RepID=A0A6A1V752_9ROSI|nr:Coatomer subunit delta [Morella rubra]
MPDFGFSLFQMSGRPIPVDMGVLAMEIMVGEVKEWTKTNGGSYLLEALYKALDEMSLILRNPFLERGAIFIAAFMTRTFLPRWSFNFFFYSKRLKRVLSFPCLPRALILIFAFDEVISLGHKENMTVAQVKQHCEMESHEEKLHKLVLQSKINETKDHMKCKASEIEKSKLTSLINIDNGRDPRPERKSTWSRAVADGNSGEKNKDFLQFVLKLKAGW